ncbi:hypothetical protein BDW22DRAFT_1425328 [Trametopsis cervina]|nr:hypothetical protein BDW22DRAFT_1425328 [Trametopsis cervina]
MARQASSFNGFCGRLAATAFFLLSTLCCTAVAQSNSSATPDPNAPQGLDIDPKLDPSNPLKYITNNWLTTIGLIIMLTVFAIHTRLIIYSKSKFMIVIVVAEFGYAVGIAARYGLHFFPDSKNMFIFEYLFLTLSPCGFVAAEYVILGRLVRAVGGDKHLLIRPSRVALAFLCSDVFTFIIQASAFLLVTAHTDINKAHLGLHLFLAGLIIQLVSFSFFFAIFFHFIFRMWKYERKIWTRDRDQGQPWYYDWRVLLIAMTVSCIGIIVRSAYRTAEIAEDNSGPLTTEEIFFWVLDFIPLLVALSVYIPFWPGWYIGPKVTEAPKGALNEVEFEDDETEKLPLYQTPLESSREGEQKKTGFARVSRNILVFISSFAFFL